MTDKRGPALLLDRDAVASWNAPILITGCARSGTTALASALSTHPRFCIFSEYHLYYRHADKHHLWNYIHEMPDDNHPPAKVCASLAELRNRMLAEFCAPVSDTQVRCWLYQSISQSPWVFGDKMPYKYLKVMDEIIAVYPRSKFLITIRDGRAVIASQIRRYKKAAKAGKTPEQWMKPAIREAEYLWLRSMKRWLSIRHNPPAPCLEIRYEQAVQDPENLARKICEFIGVDYRKTDFEEFLKTYKPINTDTWRYEIEDLNDHLSDDFHDALRQLDYK